MGKEYIQEQYHFLYKDGGHKMRTLFSLVIVISGLILGCDNAVSPTSTLPTEEITEEITERDMWGYLSGKWELSEPVGDIKKQSLNFDGSTKTVKIQEVISSPARTATLSDGTIINIPARNLTANVELAFKTYKKGNVEIISMDKETFFFNYTVQKKGPNNMIWTLISSTDPPKSLKSLEPVTIDGKKAIYRYRRVPPR